MWRHLSAARLESDAGCSWRIAASTILRPRRAVGGTSGATRSRIPKTVSESRTYSPHSMTTTLTIDPPNYY